MAKPTILDWIKYYARYAHVKVKRAGIWTGICCCLPCTCGMSIMGTDNYPWWDLPKKPGVDTNNPNGQDSSSPADSG
ncbi:unnamed protein product [Fusarium graminearum]|uniref:Chromosome 2, complete genome n=2 Tax=Gibberella zeae TaxID=5518 RepID=A0A098DCT5_GIBZE|nr:unnamed protein product [Fusarium graminearum]CAG1969191.1 unnamed protein product [Fusarium graminearum]CAG2008361.1 unnamed protein product [Fusarium graminearum]CAG2010212.1 unnamed protein product [Fusarium graminearum]CAG2012553.1 unnamed protein product [Fusarium graminearum]